MFANELDEIVLAIRDLKTATDTVATHDAAPINAVEQDAGERGTRKRKRVRLRAAESAARDSVFLLVKSEFRTELGGLVESAIESGEWPG